MKCSFAVIYVFDYIAKLGIPTPTASSPTIHVSGYLSPVKTGSMPKRTFPSPTPESKRQKTQPSVVRLRVRRDHNPGTVSKPVNL
jgi:hypothetical protein